MFSSGIYYFYYSFLSQFLTANRRVPHGTQKMQLMMMLAFLQFFRVVIANSSTLIVATCSEGFPPFVIPDGQGGFSGYDIGDLNYMHSNPSFW
jgi:hypothetical protein